MQWNRGDRGLRICVSFPLWVKQVVLSLMFSALCAMDYVVSIYNMCCESRTSGLVTITSLWRETARMGKLKMGAECAWFHLYIISRLQREPCMMRHSSCAVLFGIPCKEKLVQPSPSLPLGLILMPKCGQFLTSLGCQATQVWPCAIVSQFMYNNTLSNLKSTGLEKLPPSPLPPTWVWFL